MIDADIGLMFALLCSGAKLASIKVVIRQRPSAPKQSNQTLDKDTEQAQRREQEQATLMGATVRERDALTPTSEKDYPGPMRHPGALQG